MIYDAFQLIVKYDFYLHIDSQCRSNRAEEPRSHKPASTGDLLLHGQSVMVLADNQSYRHVPRKLKDALAVWVGVTDISRPEVETDSEVGSATL